MTCSVPREMGSSGAALWCARQLTQKQFRALEAFPGEQDWRTARELGATPGTLLSLMDVARHKRDVQPPLICVTREFAEFDRRYSWRITQFGLEVLQAAKALATANGTGTILEVHVDGQTLERLQWYARERDIYGADARGVTELAEAAVAEAALRIDTRPDTERPKL